MELYLPDIDDCRFGGEVEMTFIHLAMDCSAIEDKGVPWSKGICRRGANHFRY